MNYSTVETLINKIDERLLVQYVNDEGRPAADIDLSDEDDACVIRIDQACKEVTEEIESYLRGRYKLPLSSVPSIIQTISDDRVIYSLKKRRFRDSFSESELKIFNDSTKQLQQIQTGNILLDAAPVNEDAGAGQIFTNKKTKSKFSILLDKYE